jgi:hypothetical protein
MENLSNTIIILFLLTTLASILLFFKATHHSVPALLVLLAISIAQSLLSLSGFYFHWESLPPRFVWMLAPAFLLIIFLFVTAKGKQFIDQLSLKWLTLLHTIRIPVEITLLALAIAHYVPFSMTFEESNFDILSGISAPLLWFFIFRLKKGNRTLLLGWNFICLALLFNVVITALLSAKTPFQQFAFDQPNIGIAYFPFVLLPAVVVPLVLFAHLAAIRQLLKNKQSF